AHPEFFGEELTRRLVQGRETTGTAYSRSLEWAQRWRSTLAQTFQRVDVVVTPTVPISAPMIRVMPRVAGKPSLTEFTRPWCLARGPSLNVPIGFARHSPVGMLVNGPPGAEDLVLSVGEAFQGATDWHGHRPVATVA
ncbi:MAG TPA: hypothetical protein H9830_06125, partial [Candidatus Agrococcus pullicola]|nr:hypothetical protein [Candidatus Agrococcus pullicola]